MKTLLREARFATLSLLCVLLGFVFFWAQVDVATGYADYARLFPNG